PPTSSLLPYTTLFRSRTEKPPSSAGCAPPTCRSRTTWSALSSSSPASNVESKTRSRLRPAPAFPFLLNFLSEPCRWMISSLPEADQLVVRDVTKKFFDLTAVDGVSFSLKKGEVLGLIGPNGSGKSTLINVITGVLPPTSGSVSVDGVPIAGKPQHEIARAGVARTFQHVELFAGLTVLENVVVGALNVHLSRRAATEDALALLDYFGLADLRDAPADSLPYGHERLLEIARALAMRPRYLFLDEPAAGLDESESSMLLR